MKKIDLTTSKIFELNEFLKDFQKPSTFYANLQHKIDVLEQNCINDCAQITSDIKSGKIDKKKGNAQKEKKRKKCREQKKIINDEMHQPYKLFSESMKSYNFTNKLGVTCCPYCNMKDITSIIEIINENNVDKVCRPDIDHFQPQSLYPEKQLELKNLVPCCVDCNRNIKKQKNFTLTTHCNPYYEGFDEVMEFNVESLTGEYEKKEDINIKIVVKNGKEGTDEAVRAGNNKTDFKLESRYKADTPKNIVLSIFKRKKLWFKLKQRELENISDMKDEIELALFENEFCDINTTEYGKLIRDIIRIYVRN